MLLERKKIFYLLFCVILSVLIPPIIGGYDSDEDFIKPDRKNKDCKVCETTLANFTNILQDFKREWLAEVNDLISKSCTNKSTTYEGVLGDGRECLIKNRRYPEYLYPANIHYDSERRHVFTYIPEWEGPLHAWRFEFTPRNKESDGQYKIKSVLKDEYLYAGWDQIKYDEDRRHIFTWMPKTTCETQCYWDVQLVRQGLNAEENYYTIRNIHYGEYLYAAAGNYNYDESRRHVFTWKFDPTHNVQTDHTSQWLIKCK